MGFQEAISWILKPIVINGKEYRPGVTSDRNGVRQDFDAPRPGRNHGGVDINYRDENGNPVPSINTTNPDVSSPVSGTITDINKRWGMIEITDAYGNKHLTTHLDSWEGMEKGTTVTAGQTIGKMGARGLSDPTQIHVDYKIKRPDGRYMDPEDFYNDTFRRIMLNYEGINYDAIKKSFSKATVTPSPISLDLDGDGIETLARTGGTYFDHDANGFAEQTGWIGQDDGLLVMDRNGDGIINDGKELFGDQTILSNGTKASNGFQALSELDENKDGKIDSNDSAYNQLKIWQDIDGDGYSSSDELISLSNAGIQSINTGYTNTNITDSNGNTIKQAGSFTKTDGTTGDASDVYFQTDNMYTIANEWIDVPEDIAELPDLQGYGNVYDLQQAMAREALSGQQSGVSLKIPTQKDRFFLRGVLV